MDETCVVGLHEALLESGKSGGGAPRRRRGVSGASRTPSADLMSNGQLEEAWIKGLTALRNL